MESQPAPAGSLLGVPLWPAYGWDTLRFAVLGNGAVAARDDTLLLLPLLSLRRPLNRLLPVLGLMVCLLCFNPVTGPLWHRLLTSEAYWRLYYLLPLPLCFGLTVLAARQLRPLRPASCLRLGGLVVVTAAGALAFQKPVLSRENGVELKSPGEYRFRSADLAFVRRVGPLLIGRTALAADPVANVLSLTHEGRVALVYPRAAISVPANPRYWADRVLSQCSTSERDLEGVRTIVGPEVQALVMRDCPRRVEELLQGRLAPRRLRERVRDGGFVLFDLE